MAYCAYCGSHVDQVSFVPCASCGNPTNGAPARPKTAAPNPAGIIIGVVAAALVVFAVIGILAAIAIPNLITAMERSRQKRTMADIRTVATALEAWGTDHEQLKDYPDADSVAALAPQLEPTYVKKLPTKDGWETEMRYVQLAERGYMIISAGKDKLYEHDSPDRYRAGEVANFDCDIVFANGSFVQYPGNVARAE